MAGAGAEAEAEADGDAAAGLESAVDSEEPSPRATELGPRRRRSVVEAAGGSVMFPAPSGEVGRNWMSRRAQAERGVGVVEADVHPNISVAGAVSVPAQGSLSVDSTE